MQKFLKIHGSEIAGVLSGFDRVRFRGTFRQLCHVPGVMSWLSHASVLLKDCVRYFEGATARFREGIESLAERVGRPVQYLSSTDVDKEALVQHTLHAKGVGAEGVVAVLKVIELCSSYEVHQSRERQRLELQPRKRKCLHYYVYLQHPRFGLVHVRMPSWVPFGAHLVINGREWLARDLDAAGIAYQQADNCFPWIADFSRAQKLMDAQLTTNWSQQLTELYQRVQPQWNQLLPGFESELYWGSEQTEWATDVAFRSPASLDAIQPALLQHAMTAFGSCDVLRFLGSRPVVQGTIPPALKAEVTSDLKRRVEGTRIKHRLGHNSVKMYDKQGTVLRIETTINDARRLTTFRKAEGDPQGKAAYRPLRKGVADLRRRSQLSQSTNERYLDGLAAADCSTPLKKFTARLTQRTESEGRWFRALNPLGADAPLLAAILRAEFLVTGFRNADIRHELPGCEPCSDPAENRCRAARVSRLLRLLRAHGLVKKIPKTHRYLPTAFAQECLPAILAALESPLKKLTAA